MSMKRFFDRFAPGVTYRPGGIPAPDLPAVEGGEACDREGGVEWGDDAEPRTEGPTESARNAHAANQSPRSPRSRDPRREDSPHVTCASETDDGHAPDSAAPNSPESAASEAPQTAGDSGRTRDSSEPVPVTDEAVLARRIDVLNEVLRGQAAQLERLGDRAARARLVPVVRTLADLHELLHADAASADAGRAEDLAYYRGFVEDALDALGVVARAAEPGSPVDPRRHRVLRVIDVDDPALDRTIADGPLRHSYEFDGADPIDVVVKAAIQAHRLRPANATPEGKD